ncbi:MAG: phosphotransferase [Anaerolineae bacterium]
MTILAADEEIPLPDANTSVVVRVGDTVRRVPGYWTPAVHTLLRHLKAAGFEGAPRVLGFDARGREMLTFIPGQTIPPSLTGYRSDATLAAVAALLRCCHDATAEFRPAASAAWRAGVGAPGVIEVMCHNDIAPWNTIVRDGEPVAFIDWDFAAPGRRIWDVAYALWRFVPLYPDASFGSLAERAQRIRLFCDAYGLEDRRGLLAVVEWRQAVHYSTLAAWAESGLPAFERLWREGHGEAMLRDLTWLRTHRVELERLIGGARGA